MNRKTYVKCKYSEKYANTTIALINGILHHPTISEWRDKFISGEFESVSWDGEKLELTLKEGKKKITIHEFSRESFKEMEAEFRSISGNIRTHIATCIEYLEIDGFIAVDEREDTANEET
jgi:hypothetical protein